MNINKWVKQNFNELKDKIIVVTGTTNGLGKNLLEHLALVNAEVVCGVRNTIASDLQIAELKNKYPKFNATSIELDLTNIDSIKAFVSKVENLYPNGVYALVLNAGIFAQKKEKLASNFEKHFFVNTISSCYLANAFIKLLNKQINSRLVFVSSISFKSAKINLGEPDKFSESNSIKTYANSKRWLTFYATELKRKLKVSHPNICVNICHPGISATTLMSPSRGRFNKFTSSILTGGMKLLFPSSQHASLSELFALTHQTDNEQWIGPSFLNVYGKPKAQKLKIKFKEPDICEKCYNAINKTLKTL